MNAFQESLTAGRNRGWSHLGSGDSLREQIGLEFEATRAALAGDLDDLRRLNVISAVAISAGIALVLAGAVTAMAGRLSAGVLTAILGAVSNAYSFLLFRRIERTRMSLQKQLPDYRHLFALLAVIDADKSEQTGTSLAGILERLQPDSAGPSANVGTK